MAERATNFLSPFLNSIRLHAHFNTLCSHLSSISTQFNSSLSSAKSSIPNFNRIRFINSFNQTIALTIPTLANLLQLKKSDPFATHPTTMRLAVSTTVLLHLAHTALLRFPLRSRAAMIADQCFLSIGNVSVASLASVLLPDSLSPFVFTVFGLLSAAELMYWLCGKLDGGDEEEGFDVRRKGVLEILSDVWEAFGDFCTQPQPILPP